MLLSIREAARQWGVSRATLQRHVAAGKLSQTTDATGKPGIDPAEMVRVYGEPGRSQAGPIRPPEAATEATIEQATKVARLEAEVSGLRDLVAEKDRRISDLQNAVALLGHEKAEQPARRKRWPWGKG